MKRQGFTIIELVVIIAVMGILLVLGVVNLSGSQASSRDAERKTDIETIATHLETYYTSGNDDSVNVGRYPSTGLPTQETLVLRDIDPQSYMAPGMTTTSLIAATNNIQTTAGVLPQPTINQYVYQPLQQDGTLCTTGAQQCQKFNLFYRLETDNTVYMLTSRNQ